MFVLQIVLFCVGLVIVAATVQSAVVTFILPRGASHFITLSLFRVMRWLFDIRLQWAPTYAARDRIMALYAPISLLLVVPLWLVLVALGYACMYWGAGMYSFGEVMTLSGSSLLTLGFATGHTPLHTVMEFTEATIGLILVALLISYLPTIYNAFSRREVAVNQLAVRAGSPPSALEMLVRTHRIGALGNMLNFWVQWETWFAEVEETHTSLAALVYFRSPQPQQSWVTAAGAVLDSAALIASTVDQPRQPQVDLCIRAGYLCLQRIVEFHGISFNPTPKFPQEPISIAREEYDQVYEQMLAAGVPLRQDREQAWLDFAGWRVNYDRVLLVLSALTMAPYAPWSSDRSIYESVSTQRKRRRRFQAV